MASHDVTIRGAGIFGLSIAWACVRRGARVQVVDPAGPGAGASGGLVGALAPHVPENWNPKKQFQLESLLAAEPFWAEVRSAGGVDPGYVRSGRLQPLANAAAIDLAKARCAGAASLWRDKAVWEVIPCPEGWSPVSPTGWVIRDSLSAIVHPRRAIAALVAALRSKGTEILPNAPDKGAVIWATGAAGLAELSRMRDQPVGQGIKGQAALLQLDRSGMPQIFAEGIHVIAHQDGTVAVGSTTERDYDDPTATDQLLETVIQTARAHVPALARAPVLDRWAGLRPRARSRAPLLGRWPDRPKHFIANGGFKIGFGMAPRIAEVMADLVLDNHDQIPEDFHTRSAF